MLSLILMGGANSYAAKTYWSPSSPWASFANCKWTAGTNTFSWDGTNVTVRAIPTGFSGDLSGYTKFHATVSDLTGDGVNKLQLKVNCTGGSEKFIDLNSGENLIDMTDWFANPSAVTTFELWGPKSSDEVCSAVLTDVYIEAPDRTLDVDLSAMAASSGEAMWDNTSKTFSWKAKWSNSIALPGLTGNLCAYSAISFVTSAGTCDHFRIIIYLTNGVQKTWSGNVGTTSVTFASLGLKQEDLTSVSSINISGAGDGDPSKENPLSIIVTSISLEGPAVCPIIASTIYKKPEGSTSKLEDLSGNYPSWQKWPDTFHYFETIGGSTVFCGNGDGSSESSHVDLGGADYICFDVIEVSSGGAPLRVWLWDGSTSSVKTIFAYPIADYATADYSSSSSISSVGTYVAKVTGYNDLKGIKTAGAGGSIKISLAYTCSGDPIAYVPTRAYKLYGESTGDASLTAALADADACYYDATSVIGTSVDLTSVANKNALFKANAGALANTNNVIVGSTCANLVLTDGNYPFKAPTDFTATSVSYNRTFTVDQPSTVCLPFALTADQVTAAGTFYTLTDYSTETLTFTEVATTEAYKPYLFIAKVANPFSSCGGKDIDETPTEIEDLSVTADDATMTGTLARQSVNGKYGWNSEGGAFSKATSDEVTIDPFRAYITISGVSPARMAARFVDNSVTGINEVSETQNILNPDRKYIENGKIVIVKNGVKYNAAGQLLK